MPGLQPSNEVAATRDSFGVYGDLEWEPTEALLIGGAIRYEDFSDNTSWKVNARYSLGEKGALKTFLPVLLICLRITLLLR